MALTGAQLVTKIAVESDAEAKAKIASVGQQVDKTKEQSDKASGGLAKMFTNALAFAGGQAIFAGLGFLAGQIGDIFQQSTDAQAGLAQTNEVIKSTGGVAGVTAQAVLDLATKYSHLTQFSDDTVQSASNMLLTFTNIGKNVFPQATKTVLDMSQALGQDTKNSAIQLGKALNDPITGVSALQRVGVTFTQGQKDAIKAMMDTGNMAGAQGVILKELSKEFGGSAEAAGKTFPGQLKILGQNFDDLKQNIGDAVIPVLARLVGWVTGSVVPAMGRLSDWLGSHLGPALQAAGGFIQKFISYLQGDQFQGLVADFQSLGIQIEQHVAPVLQRLMPILQQIGGFFQSAFSQIGPLLTNVVIPAIDNVVFFIGALLSGVKPMDPIFKGVWNVFMQLGKVLQDVGGFLQSTFAPVWQQLVTVWTTQILPSLKQLWSALTPLLPVFAAIGGIILGVVVVAMGVLVGVIGGLLKALAGWLTGVATVIGGVVQLFTGVVQVISGIVRFIYDLVTGNFKNLGNDLKGIWLGIENIFGGAWNIIKGIFQAAWGAISGFVSGLVSGVIGFFQHLADMLVGHSIIPDMIGAIVGWFLSLPGKALNAVGGLLGNLVNFFGGLARQAVQWGLNIIANLAGGIINGIWSSLGNAMSAIGTFIHDHLPASPAKIGPLRDLAKQGSLIPDQIAQGIMSGIPKLQPSLNLMLAPRMSGIPAGFGGAGISGLSPSSGGMTQVNLQINGYTFARLMLPSIVQAIRTNIGITNI